MDLNLFSSDAVVVLLDLIYGEETSKISNVDVGNVLKLADYLQIPEYILTEILRRVISADNFMKLHELALSFNCTIVADYRRF